MVLSIINIQTGQLDQKANDYRDLRKFTIKFDVDDIKIHSIIFSQDHIGEKLEGYKEQLASFINSLYVGVIFSRKEEEDKPKKIMYVSILSLNS